MYMCPEMFFFNFFYHFIFYSDISFISVKKKNSFAFRKIKLFQNVLLTTFRGRFMSIYENQPQSVSHSAMQVSELTRFKGDICLILN